MTLQKVVQLHLPAEYAGGWCRGMQFLGDLLSNSGWFNSTLRLQIERGTPLYDVQQAATYARAGAGR